MARFIFRRFARVLAEFTFGSFPLLKRFADPLVLKYDFFFLLATLPGENLGIEYLDFSV